MEEEEKDAEPRKVASLEHMDSKESMRQLWLSVAVILIGIALAAYFYL